MKITHEELVEFASAEFGIEPNIKDRINNYTPDLLDRDRKILIEVKAWGTPNYQQFTKIKSVSNYKRILLIHRPDAFTDFLLLYDGKLEDAESLDFVKKIKIDKRIKRRLKEKVVTKILKRRIPSTVMHILPTLNLRNKDENQCLFCDHRSDVIVSPEIKFDRYGLCQGHYHSLNEVMENIF